MTRWARANNAHKLQAHGATPWTQMKKEACAQDDKRKNESSNRKPTQERKKSVLMKTGGIKQAKWSAKNTIKKQGFKERFNANEGSSQGNMKKICFQCRKPGHVVANCPTGGSSGTARICYKCGSTEHISKHCSKKGKLSDGQYPFALCFLCGEQGHLAQSCKQNENGIYPNGGSCHHCKSVHHLREHCPQLNGTKESDSETLTVCHRLDITSADSETSLKRIVTSKAEKDLKVVRIK